VAIETPVGAFVDDIGAALAAWRKAPLVPIVTTLLSASTVVTIPPHDNFPSFLVGLSIGFFSLGWFGTQFIWYQRTFDGQPFHPRELFPLTWSFIARYVRLYFLALIPLFVLVFVAIRWRTFGFTSPGWRIGVLVYLVAFDVACTFINPSLAFYTRKLREAVPIGLRMAAQGWPGNWQYLVVPGAAQAVLGGLYWLVPSPVGPMPEILITLTSLVFAGAIARYYLRTPSARSNGGYRGKTS
jgi:hypothetical protein